MALILNVKIALLGAYFTVRLQKIEKTALYYLGLVIITSPIFNTKKAQLSL